VKLTPAKRPNRSNEKHLALPLDTHREIVKALTAVVNGPTGMVNTA
jgi:hypothetical protein